VIESSATLDGLPGLVLTSALVIAVPGPSILFLVGQALPLGRRRALLGVLGNAVGTYAVAVVLALGIGSLLMSSGQALASIRLWRGRSSARPTPRPW